VGFANYKPVWLIESGRMAIPPEKVGALETLLGLPSNTLLWKECRCRLLRLGFDVDQALEMEEEPQAAPPAESRPTYPAVLAEGRDAMDQVEKLTTGATDLRSEISHLVRRGREKLHLSQERIAQLAGFRGKEPIWLIEHGRMAIPPDRLLPLAQVLGLDPHELLLAEIRCRLQAMGFDDALLSAAEVLLPGPLALAAPDRTADSADRSDSPADTSLRSPGPPPGSR
jgi:transcriptional regulator with XRE-family HTH domain